MATATESKRRYWANRESILRSRRQIYAANRSAMKATIRARWMLKSPEERRFLQRRRQVKYMYHLSPEAHDELLREQNHICPISGMPVDIYSAIDHDRRCCPGAKSCGGCIRGVISHKVNAALGVFEDDPKRLLKAYEYLRADHAQ